MDKPSPTWHANSIVPQEIRRVHLSTPVPTETRRVRSPTPVPTETRRVHSPTPAPKETRSAGLQLGATPTNRLPVPTASLVPVPSSVSRRYVSISAGANHLIPTETIITFRS
jgi:hypothetical protein